MRTRKRLSIAALAAALMLFAATPVAEAVTRYASPTGLNMGNCTDPDPINTVDGPCNIQRAIEHAVTPDEVIVTPGTYNVGSDEIDAFGQSINIHGADGQPFPRIVSSADSAFVVNAAGTTVRRLWIEHSGAFRAFHAFDVMVAEQIIAHSTGGFAACWIGNDELIRDSVCWSTAANGAGLYVLANSGGPFTAQIRNLTAVATGTGSYGLYAQVFNTNIEQTLSAKNVIADGVGADVHAAANGAGTVATVTLSSSNYATELEAPGAGAATVTDPGPPNQIAPPIFSDAGVGLFHQAFDSPTINAGDNAADLLGASDVDGETRLQNGTVDIGADEGDPQQPATMPPTQQTPLTNPLAPAVQSPAPPDTKKKCKRKKAIKDAAAAKKKRCKAKRR